MLKRFFKILAVGIFLHCASPGWAFSLLGPFNTTWMVPPLGYGQTGLGFDGLAGFAAGSIGGPMNLDEEYRVNTPTLYYAIDRTFLDYFGERGGEEIDKAVKILNDLPSASDLNVDDYPLKSDRINNQARALGLIDLKSFTLMCLVRHIGLASPSRFVFTVRQRITNPGSSNYIIIKRNFDPVTWRPTSYINGDLWTYTSIIDNQLVPTTFPIVTRVDPLGSAFPVADVLGAGATEFSVGNYFTGLTRDDVGGLKYIYRKENLNVENATTNTFGLSGPIAVSTGGGGNTGSPWVGIPIGSTNTAGGGGIQVGGPGGPWTPVFIPQTSTNGGGAVVPTNIVIPVTTNAFVVTALRGGVDKVNFIKVEYDSLLGQFIAPVLDSFTDSIVTNASRFSQTLGRIVTVPDVIFNASDLFAAGDVTPAILVFGNGLVRLATIGWDNNLLLNNGNNLLATSDSGPGVIEPGMMISFNKVGPAILNGSYPNNLSEDTGGIMDVVWGAFDGSTNAPVIFPNNVSIQDLERQIFGQ